MKRPRALVPVGSDEPAAKRLHLLKAGVTCHAHPPRGAGSGPSASKKSSPAAPAANVIDKDSLWLVVGLGNPGANYERTRHNVGFMVVDELARLYGIDCRKLEKSAAVGKGRVEGQLVLLVKPMTFMNNSGESVAALAKFYKVPSQRILVISDDLDIAHAALRFRKNGGHGGHNGLRSIIERMGNTQDFPRIKIGIGRPAGQLPIATWVLQDFTRKEMESLEVTLQQAVDIVKTVCARGLDKALSEQAANSKVSNASKASAPGPKAPATAGPGSQAVTAPGTGPAAGAAARQQAGGAATQQGSLPTAAAAAPVTPVPVTVGVGARS